MPYWYSSESGRLSLRVSVETAQSASHQGQCDSDVEELRRRPDVKRQVDAWDAEELRRELRGYGAWDADELADDDANRTRMLWLACGDIVEEARQ